MLLVDLRTIVGRPHRDLPIKIPCPLHDDPGASLAVYEDHLFCYGACHRYFRRYAGAALLLGLWDGNPETEVDAVRKVELEKLETAEPKRTEKQPPEPVDPRAPRDFHRFLKGPMSGRLNDYLIGQRGFTEETIDLHQIGHTGTHFSLPVFGWSGELVSIRFRADPLYTLADGNKYSGLSGHNETVLYPLPSTPTPELFITEGELDALATIQAGKNALTLTNGAGSLYTLPKLLDKWYPQAWVLATDLDEAGWDAARKLWESIRGLGRGANIVRAIWPSGKDLSEFLASGGTMKDVKFLEYSQEGVLDLETGS